MTWNPLFWMGIMPIRKFVDYNGLMPYTKVTRFRWWKPWWMRVDSYRKYHTR
jgi:hypothetical protein